MNSIAPPTAEAVSKLSVRRVVDRQKIAELIVGLAESLGCQALRVTGDAYPGPRVIRLVLEAPGGLCLTVTLDGNAQRCNDHVLSWHMLSASSAQLDPLVFGPEVNKYHFQKSTDVAIGTTALLEILKVRLTQAQDGSAYRQVKQPVAKSHSKGLAPLSAY